MIPKWRQRTQSAKYHALVKAFQSSELEEVKQIAEEANLSKLYTVSFANQVLMSPHADVVEYARKKWKLDISNLQIAVICGDVKEVESYLADLDTQSRKAELEKDAALERYAQTSHSPLTLAVRNGHLQIVEKLIEYGAFINEESRYNLTPLANAAELGHAEIVTLLIKAGAKVDADPDGYTPLSRACIGGDAECVKLLLEAGGEPECFYFTVQSHPSFPHWKRRLREAAD